jgi:Signal peptide binding domain
VQASRVTRIACGSGHAVPEVLALLEEHKRLAKMFQGGFNSRARPPAMISVKIVSAGAGGAQVACQGCRNITSSASGTAPACHALGLPCRIDSVLQ